MLFSSWSGTVRQSTRRSVLTCPLNGVGGTRSRSTRITSPSASPVRRSSSSAASGLASRSASARPWCTMLAVASRSPRHICLLADGNAGTGVAGGAGGGGAGRGLGSKSTPISCTPETPSIMQ